MNKVLVFDASSIISLATNGLIDALRELKKLYNGRFVISESIRRELVDVPFNNKKYKLEAMQVSRLIDDHVLEVVKANNFKNTLDSVNNIFSLRGKPMQLLHAGEIEDLLIYQQLGAEGFVVDERTMRLFLEDINEMHQLLERKLHKRIDFNRGNAREFQKKFSGISVIRSCELMAIAYERGLLSENFSERYGKEEQIDALMWGLRLRGCAVSTDEIEMFKKLVKKH